jgi:hypothetical protein
MKNQEPLARARAAQLICVSLQASQRRGGSMRSLRASARAVGRQVNRYRPLVALRHAKASTVGLQGKMPPLM